MKEDLKLRTRGRIDELKESIRVISRGSRYREADLLKETLLINILLNENLNGRFHRVNISEVRKILGICKKNKNEM